MGKRKQPPEMTPMPISVPPFEQFLSLSVKVLCQFKNIGTFYLLYKVNE